MKKLTRLVAKRHQLRIHSDVFTVPYHWQRRACQHHKTDAHRIAVQVKESRECWKMSQQVRAIRRDAQVLLKFSRYSLVQTLQVFFVHSEDDNLFFICKKFVLFRIFCYKKCVKSEGTNICENKFTEIVQTNLMDLSKHICLSIFVRSMGDLSKYLITSGLTTYMQCFIWYIKYHMKFYTRSHMQGDKKMKSHVRFHVIPHVIFTRIRKKKKNRKYNMRSYAAF